MSAPEHPMPTRISEDQEITKPAEGHCTRLEVPSEYTVYPDLNEPALKAKEDKLLRFWYILRSVAPRGYMPVARAFGVLRELTKYSNSSIHRILQEGDEKLWSVATPKTGHKHVYPRSVGKVAERYGIPSPPGLRETQTGKVWTELTGQPEEVRAWLYKRSVARIRNEKDAHGRLVTKPISRAKIAERTGVGKHTQLRYEHKARMRKLQNYAKSRKTGKPPGEEGHKFAELRITPDGDTDLRAGGLGLYRQLPNSYPPFDEKGDFTYGPNGPRHRANRQLRRGLQSLNAHDRRASALNSFEPRAPYALAKQDSLREKYFALFAPTGSGRFNQSRVGLWEEREATEAVLTEILLAS